MFQLTVFLGSFFLILLQIQQENNFLPTSKHPQGKVRRFLGIFLYDYFIYRSNSRAMALAQINVSRRDAILAPVS